MKLGRFLGNLGIDPRVAVLAAGGLMPYLRDRRDFYGQVKGSGSEFRLARTRPHLADRRDKAGTARGHYFHQDLLVAQRIYAAAPRKHVDVGSRVDGFISHVAAFRTIEVHDIRPLETSASQIDFICRDVTDADPAFDDYCDSLSCLHALEHFGLGRYGDAVEYYAYKDGLDNLVRMLQPGGTLYLSVPVSRDQRIEFNAHRVFSIPYLLELATERGLSLIDLSIVNDAGDLLVGVHADAAGIARTFDLSHGCAIMTLRSAK
jgi:hypothetical protein